MSIFNERLLNASAFNVLLDNYVYFVLPTTLEGFLRCCRIRKDLSGSLYIFPRTIPLKVCFSIQIDSQRNFESAFR